MTMAPSCSGVFNTPPRNHFVDLTHAPNETQDSSGVFTSFV